MALGGRRKSHRPLAMVRSEADEPTKGMGKWQTFQKGFSVLSLNAKAIKSKCTFRLARVF